jgi:hypothetical protein
MSHVITSPAPAKAPTPARVVGRWMVSFLGFPLGGFAALALSDPVDSIGNALIGGLLTGAVLGAVQAWALRSDHRQLIAWTIATALGLAAGLALGARLVHYHTGIGDLALQGAVTAPSSDSPRQSCSMVEPGPWPPCGRSTSPVPTHSGGWSPRPAASRSKSSSPPSAPTAP